MRDPNRMWNSLASSSTVLLLATLLTGASGSAQLYDFGPALDESLAPADELYIEVNLVDPVLYLGTQNTELYVSPRAACYY